MVAPMGLFRKKFIVVIVCKANVTRSAYLRAYMMHHLRQNHPGAHRKLLVLSAGIHARCGGGASDVVQQVARLSGFSLRGHRSYPLDQRLARVADVILVMESMQKTDIAKRFPEAKGKTFRLTEYLRSDGDKKGWDIADPTGMGAPDYKEFIKDAHNEVGRICRELKSKGII